MKLFVTFAVVVFGLLAGSSYAAEGPQMEVLNSKSPWRVYWRNGPRLAGANGKYKVFNDRFEVCKNADPATDWAAPDFRDGDWAFGGIEGSLAWEEYGGIPMICSRGRFGVTDPAKVSGLSLTLAYRGGVIVYVNGKEIGRGNMPEGKIDAATLANDYPEAAFLMPDGKMIPDNRTIRPGKVPPALRDRIEMRTRKTTLAIPASALRKGTNVLAIENHRSATYKGAGFSNQGWPTSGLEEIHLTAPGSAAIKPNIATPKGVYVWNVGLTTMVGADVSAPDPFVKVTTIKLQSPRGGDGSGQVVVSADVPLTGLAAVCSDLTEPGGAKIPASSVSICYPQNGGTYVKHVNPFDALADKPMAEAKLQPLWVNATVPANAKPGTYKGTLSLSGPTTTKIPVELTVYGWTLPDPKQWKTKTSFFQSPENLAKYYKVPLWSDAHFKLIEQSLILQGKLGDRVAHVLAVGADKSNASLGAETMVLFKREGEKVTPDFTAVERYLKLYKQHVGDPDAFVLHLWTIHVDSSRPKKDRSVMVTFRAGDKLQRGTLPPYEDTSSARLWEEVVAGMKRTMKSLDWPESSLQIGMSEDTQPSKKTTLFFNKHFPDIKWALLSHMRALPPGFKSGVYYGPAGYGDYTHNRRGWKNAEPWFTLQRGLLNTNAPLTDFRFSPLAALLTGANGPGGNGMDRWEDKATRCYGLGWGQIMRGNPSSILAPGLDGPIPTVRYEMMRAGFIEAQAMIYVEDNAGNPNLPAPLAKRAKAVCPRILHLIGSLHARGTVHWDDEMANLFQTAADMQTVLTEQDTPLQPAPLKRTGAPRASRVLRFSHQ